jgi:hypothetical protein
VFLLNIEMVGGVPGRCAVGGLWAVRDYNWLHVLLTCFMHACACVCCVLQASLS